MILVGGSLFIQSNTVEIEKKKLDELFVFSSKSKFLLGANFGPYRDVAYKNLCSTYFKNLNDVCFRDQKTYKLFSELNSVRVGTDIAFAIGNDKIDKIVVKKRVIISVKDLSFVGESEKKINDYKSCIVNILKNFIDKGYEVSLMSFCEFEGDEKAAEYIYNNLDTNYQVRTQMYNYKNNLDDAINYINSSEIVVASRYHAMILALVLNKVVIPIISSNKMLNTIRDINFKGKYIDILNIKNLNINKLIKRNSCYIYDTGKIMNISQVQFKILDRYLKDGII